VYWVQSDFENVRHNVPKLRHIATNLACR